MGFWDRLVRKKKNSRKDIERKDDGLKELVKEQEQEDAKKKAETERKAREEAERKAREEAERKAREQAAIREQERLAEANRVASQEKQVINPMQNQKPISTFSTKSVSQKNSKAPASKEQEKEEDAKTIEYINPITGKTYILRPGEIPPRGTILKDNYEPRAFNTASSAIAKSADIAEKLSTGKVALAPSTKQSQWRNFAGTGKLAKSAAKVGLSNVINVDPNKLTDAQKSEFLKEQTWKNMSYEEKTKARNTLPDKDGDLVPDMYDCVPDDYTKQGYADVYLGGKYALGPSRKMQRTIVTGKGRLKMATSMKGPKNVVGAVVNEAGVGNILDLTSNGSIAGSNPAMKGTVKSNPSTQNIMNKIMGPSKSNKSTIVKSKSNKNFQVNMTKNFKQKFDVNVINKKKFGLKAASKKGMQKPVADKVFKKMSKKYGF